MRNLKHHIGADGVDAKAKQDTHVMHLPSLASLNNDGALATQTFGDEVVVNSAGGQQGGDGHTVRTNTTVR